MTKTIFTVMFYSAIVLNSASMTFFPDDPIRILENASRVINKVPAISYDFAYDGHGKFNGNFTGTVIILRKGDPFTSRIFVELRFHNPGSSKKDVEDTWFFDIDQGRIRLLNTAKNTLRKGTMQGGSANLTSFAYYAVPFQFLQKTPFESEMSSKSLKYIGSERVAGKECDVIGVQNPSGDQVFWYVGVDDGLIYATKTSNPVGKAKGEFVFTISNLKLGTSPPESSFAFPVNKDTKIIDEDKIVIAPGRKAPNWSIRDDDGKLISSNELRGAPVLLDFWASWCSQCWKIMPVINRIGKKRKEIVTLGVNIWESPEVDVRAYMKDEKLEYKTINDKDAELAEKFKVGFFPFTILIDSQGIVVFVSSGSSKTFETDLENAIEKVH